MLPFQQVEDAKRSVAGGVEAPAAAKKYRDADAGVATPYCEPTPYYVYRYCRCYCCCSFGTL